ncbi:MAG TPA: hypothetical protein PKC65_04390 [Pyrinomonadaceae bacterium]|mgnify:CR=1 FL=1|nr:hypothetical protein [Pyrinomonadaceae bacterium]
MKILNRGSFVPLDNREKIDQLIYTARELASEVGISDGFRNSSRTNHQLGLEMWKGVEYVCRAHEEANIRNLFLSKFLERLREVEKEIGFQTQTAPTVTSPPIAVAPARSPVSALVADQSYPTDEYAESEPSAPTLSKDECLGVVSAGDQVEEKRPSYADECVPEYDAEIEALIDRLENEGQTSDVGELPTLVTAEIEQTASKSPVDVPVNEKLPVPLDSTANGDSGEVLGNEVAHDTSNTGESAPINSIVLAENEPYNFDSCTVTAVIQLLPGTEGVRKCVVSMKTHDFTPRVAIVDVSTEDFLSQISATLGLAFEVYRNELPARAAEKIKKEKPAAKKQSKAASKSSKTAAAPAKADPQPTPSTIPATADQSQQGGLFTA